MIFKNHCGHSKDEYYGTITWHKKACDLFFRYSDIGNNWNVCIRYGNNPEDYYGMPVVFHLKPKIKIEDREIIRAFIIFMNSKYTEKK